MNKLINKYLFYLGISMVVTFVCYQGVVSFFEDNPKYRLIVYNTSVDNDRELYESIKDPENHISFISYGVLDHPDKRINVSQTPLYVIVKKKNQEIIYVTNKLNDLNDYILNQLQ
ncbi:hypothetical protein ACX1C1_19765 [Paenibacillus sp. strain BS8-2]